MKIRFGLLVLSLACLGNSGCVIKSISLVGAAGKDLAAHPAALAGMTRYCVTNTVAMGGTSLATCDQLEKDAVVLKKAVKMLSDYGVMLQTLADQKNPDVESDFKSILTTAGTAGWSTLKTDRASGLTAVAGSLADGILTAWKGKKLEEVVKNHDADVKATVAKITEILQLQETNIDLARKNALGSAKGSVDFATHPQNGAPLVPLVIAQAAAFGAGEFAETAKVEMAELDSLRTSVKAFGDTHDKLAKEVSQVGDDKLFAELKTMVENIVKAANSLD